jgi:AMMECR1 domain-containing protein
MATKPTTKKELESNEFDVDTITVEETIVPKETKPKTLKDTWVIKDRTYIIADSNSPLTYTLQSKHSLRYPLLWFNKETGEQEELRYATNQNSPLVSQQKGQATLGHIIFENGVLNVPKEKQNLQKLLSLYHPALNIRYTEFDPTLEAEDELEDLELEVMALNAALEMDIDQAESIVRVEVGSRVNKMSSKEIKRDLLLLARNNPSLFIELANDDNVQLRNIAIRAVEASIVKLSPDNRTFHWGENNRKLMTVPFDENPYSAMAAFFKTDEGVEVFKSIEKKLK